MRLKHLTRFDYPKITVFVIMVVVAYFLFKNQQIASFVLSLGSIRYIGLFIAGMLFAFGFTAPIAVGFFISYAPQNIILATIIAGLGVLTADMLIFRFIRFSFSEEFIRLKKTKIFKFTGNLIEKELGHRIKAYLMYAFAGIVIASPLPDEAGITILAGLTKINQTTLGILSFILNSFGIFIFLLI